jgi:hypothetical protein
VACSSCRIERTVKGTIGWDNIDAREQRKETSVQCTNIKILSAIGKLWLKTLSLSEYVVILDGKDKKKSKFGNGESQ